MQTAIFFKLRRPFKFGKNPKRNAANPRKAVTSFFSVFLKTSLPPQLHGGHIFPATPEIIWIPASAQYMTEALIYDCPSCSTSCSVTLELVGLNVACPNCTQEFTATSQDTAADLQLPDAIPFFKSGKLEILKNHLNKLTSDGELSKSDEIALTRAALMLGLKEKDFVELTKSEFLSHFNPILERASKTGHITDEDVGKINKFTNIILLN